MRLLLALLLLLGLAASARAETLVRIEGKNFIAPDGSTLHIKGINLGNWLMPEGYMFKFEVAKAPRQIYGAFERLLGPERAQAFWRQFRDRYIARGRHPLHQVGRLQHRAHPACTGGLFMDRRRRDDRRGLGAARPRAGLGARRRASTPSSTCMPRPAARPASTTTTGRAIR